MKSSYVTWSHRHVLTAVLALGMHWGCGGDDTGATATTVLGANATQELRALSNARLSRGAFHAVRSLRRNRSAAYLLKHIVPSAASDPFAGTDSAAPGRSLLNVDLHNLRGSFKVAVGFSIRGAFEWQPCAIPPKIAESSTCSLAVPTEATQAKVRIVAGTTRRNHFALDLTFIPIEKSESTCDDGLDNDLDGMTDGDCASPPLTTAGSYHSCALVAGGRAVCWGDDDVGQTDAPAEAFTQLDAGNFHTCGLTNGGMVQCWGLKRYGMLDVPAGAYRQVNAGDSDACAVRTNGSLVCWGRYSDASAPPVLGTFRQVSMGRFHACAVSDGGKVSCWGRDTFGESSHPSGTFEQVAAGAYFTCGLKRTGNIVCWGSPSTPQTKPPSGTFVQISVGSHHGCGLRANGRISCWGDDAFHQLSSPTGHFVHVSSGGSHSCATRDASTVVCWGRNLEGQSAPVPDLD